MSPMIDDDELLVLHRLTEQNGVMLCSKIDNVDCIESLVKKGYAVRDRADLNYPNQATLKPTADGRWKYSSMCAEPFGVFTKTPRRIMKILKRKGLI